MKRIAIFTALAILTAAPAGAAQLYRWVDDKGNVEYRDTPPPSSAKKVEQRRLGGGTIEATALPFGVQQAMQNFPVTLWTTNCGGPCDQARAHLARRGVPHTEKDPQADVEAYRKLSGGLDVPVLFIGTIRMKGYIESEWDIALDAAGYPRSAPAGLKPQATKTAARRTGLPAVKLYTHPECGTPCADARLLLNSREVEFQEALASEPQVLDELQKVAGDVRVPVLLVGQVVTRGFSTSDYHQALDAAGFARPAQPAAKP
jgi:glutaredoxin